MGIKAQILKEGKKNQPVKIKLFPTQGRGRGMARADILLYREWDLKTKGEAPSNGLQGKGGPRWPAPGDLFDVGGGHLSLLACLKT